MDAKKLIIAGVAVIVVLAVSFLILKNTVLKKTDEQVGPVTLNYWGLWEDDGLIKPVILEYQKQNPNVVIAYTKQTSTNYRTRVQTQIREGVGPDIFRVHNSWMPMFSPDLAPAPADIFSLSEYKNSFYPVAVETFILNNQILAAPAEIDGLALYINEDILNAVGVSVPQTWQQFIDAATKVTVKDSSGAIKTAGAAIGNTINIDHWPDILGLLLLQQPNIDLKNPATSTVAEVLRFYTGFTTDPKRKVWDDKLPPSTQAFAQGRVAFYFAPSWRAHELRQINPNLKFKVAPVPQLPGRQVAWASFWAEAVSAKSKNKEEAWKFIKFLTSKESERLVYQNASKVRLFGEPYSQISLTPEIISDPIVGAFVSQGPYYKSWYLSSNTHDLGINDEMIKYWEDGVNATLAGTDPQIALQTVANGVSQTLNKYTKSVPQPTQK